MLGSGRSECVRAIFGADRIIGGTVKKNGRQVKITKPLDAMRHGIGYLPEDRKRDGIVGDLSVRENIILALQVLRGFFRPISRAEANKIADEYIKLLDIKTASAETPIKSLSGGNQQKVILARWLLTHPEYLILDEPTRGIDVGTKVDIQKLVLKLAGEGMSVTFISSETDEMLRTCSRLIVMRDRRVVGELSGEDLTQTKIMSTIAGGESKHGKEKTVEKQNKKFPQRIVPAANLHSHCSPDHSGSIQSDRGSQLFKITLGYNSAGDPVLSGYLMTILDYGSELAIPGYPA